MTGAAMARTLVWFYARLQSDAGVLQRFLQPFAVLERAPHLILLRRRAGHSVVAAAFDGLDGPKAAQLQARLAQIPGILAVRARVGDRDGPVNSMRLPMRG